MVKPLLQYLREIPDPRCSREKPHDHAEVLMLIILGYLAGKHSLRRIRRWCKNNKKSLEKHLKLKGGIPSISTMSRITSDVDAELLTYIFMDWAGSILSTRGIHIIIDGKALRAAAEKLKGKKAPYILNVIDAGTKMVLAQLAIPEKTNETAAIPKLLELLDITGSTVTIDAIGATSTILNMIHEKSGYFVQQIKKNCPATYKEINDLFEDMDKEKKEDDNKFRIKYRKEYDEYGSKELNRDRYEYRKMQRYSNDDSIGKIWQDVPCIKCIGLSSQVRIPKEIDNEGNDITPEKEEFLKNGSRRCPHPTEGDGFADNVQLVGLVSNKECTAKELAGYKRRHWTIENGLHHVLDEDFNEDKCSAKKSYVALSILRKIAYNIIRLIMMQYGEEYSAVIHVMDDIAGDLEIAMPYLFEPIESFY